MKFKSVLPYLLFGSLLFTPKGAGEFRETDKSYALNARQIEKQNFPSINQQIDEKAQKLCDAYIARVLQGQQNIKHSKGSHSRAVRTEFPGAFVQWYCIYGQYMQFNRAVAEMGDTLNLIPFDARHSCPEFRRQMKQKYSGSEYAGVLYDGKMFRSDKDYETARAAFMKRNNVTQNTPDSVAQKVSDRFAKNNFSVESLHPGAILIIQKSNTPSNTHAVMYLGKGHMQDGKFVPDSNGKVLYAGYNNETIDDIFATYRTNHIFAVDMLTLARDAYAKEFRKIQDMRYDDLFYYVYDVPQNSYAMIPSEQDLQQMAKEKYFNKTNFAPHITPVQVNNAAFPLFPNLKQFRLPSVNQLSAKTR